MLYVVTLLESSGCEARSHYGVGTFVVGQPRTVELTPEYADSLRVKGYRVEPVELPREQAPQVSRRSPKKALAETETEE